MSDNLRNNEGLNELLRYRNHKMSDKERYEFERAMERDPFLAEAFEGFSEIRSSDIEHDLNAIDLIAGKKRRRTKPLVYWTAAASVLILVGAFFFYSNRSIDKNISKDNAVAQNQLLFVPDTSEFIPLADTIVAVDTARVLLAENKVPEKSKKVVRLKEEESKPPARKKEADSSINKKAEVHPVASLAAIRAEVDESEVKVDADLVEKSVGAISSELVGRVVGVETELVMEVVDDAEAEVLTEDVAVKRIGVNAKPEPLGGSDLFWKYIEENLQFPASAEGQGREVVRLEFNVAVNGELSNFSILKSPENADFSKEAIRVISAGPKWSPAVRDGIPFVDKVALRIVFKSAK